MISQRSIQLAQVLLALCSATAAAQMPETKVVAVKAKLMEAPSTVVLVGTVDPARRSKVGSEIAGIVAEMPAREGDFVPAGGILCRLNADTLKHQLAEAKARLAALNARHEELLAGSRPQDLKRLKAMSDEAAADFERWSFEKQRVEKLYSASDSNEKELYDTRADYNRAERRNIAAEAAYELGLEGPRKETIARAAYEVAAQQAVVARIGTDLDKTAIRAMFAGYVVARSTEVGEWVSTGGQVVELVDLATVLVVVDAPGTAMPHMKVGDPVDVTVDAVKRRLEGHIKHIVPQADPTARTFPVEVEIDNGDGTLAAGMFARATVPSGPKKKTIAVPKDAIVVRDGIANIAMVMPGHGGMTAMLMPVTTGSDIGDWIAITSDNVPEGTTVVTRGTERILPFPMPVTIVDEQGTPVASPKGDAAHGTDGHAGDGSSQGQGGA